MEEPAHAHSPVQLLTARRGCRMPWRMRVHESRQGSPAPRSRVSVLPVETVSADPARDDRAGLEKPNIYTLTLVHHADYSEEYSAQIYAGLGTNSTQLTFNDAGVLMSTTVSVDSKANELITSLAGLIGTTPNLLRPAERRGGGEMAVPEVAKMSVEAYDVPLGYYEMVLSPGPDGHRQLYGWRYIGFMPFKQCPVTSGGETCTTCLEEDLYGLVTIGDKMYFRKLSDIAKQPEKVKVERSPVILPSPMK